MSSLHTKITLSYSLFSGLIFLLSIIAFSDLLFLGTKINEGSVVADLKNDITEIRRHEKNVLLYRDSKDLRQIKNSAKTAIENLNTHQKLYQSLINEQGFNLLLNNLKIYQAFFISPDTEFAETKMKNIRLLGHTISRSVDNLAAEERQLLASMANQSQWALAGAIFIMAILAIAIGWQMSRVISAPLKLLEKSLLHIAEGRFDFIKPATSDQEFITLSKAINRMLHELDLRHRRMLQSEKLASLGVLVSGVSHELNNPLANISSSCQLLIEEKNEANNQQIDEWLQQIDNETERAKNIVKALLDYGRKKQFQLEYISVKKMIDKSLFLLKSQLKHSAIVNIDIPDDLKINADMQRMQQVIINLVRNALNAGGENVSIHIMATPCSKAMNLFPDNIQVIGKTDFILDSDNNYCEIQIKDDGTGISKNILNKIFDPFFTTSEPGHGMGLGLYIVQEIIQDHEGCIGVISNKEDGTTFIIRLPCKDNHANDKDNNL